MSTQEMIIEICNRLNAMEFQDNEATPGSPTCFSPKLGFGYSLRYVPEENLQAMLKCDIFKCKSFDEAYQVWGRAGALHFKPYIISENKVPILVLRRNRFLQLSADLQFVVLDINGKVINTSSFTVEKFTDLEWSNDAFKKSNIVALMWWSALVDVGAHYSEFRDIWFSDIDILNNFLRSVMTIFSLSDYFIERKSWKTFEYKMDGTIPPCRYQYRLVGKGNKTLAYAAVGINTIQVETSDESLYTLDIPKLSGLGITSAANEGYMYKTLEQEHYILRLFVYLAFCAGVSINFIGVHAADKYIKPLPMKNLLNLDDVITLRDLCCITHDEY